MRWNETCVLEAKEYALDEEGITRPTVTDTEVFCNAFAIGAQTWYSMREMGISPSAEIQVRTCDYSGERDVLYRGEWYSVEEAIEAGDFTRLILRHQMSDSEETGGWEPGQGDPQGEESDG